MQNTLEQFRALRESLENERTAIRARLQQLEAVLGQGTAPAAVSGGEIPVPFKRRGRPPGSKNVVARTAANGDKLGLREAVTQVLRNGPMALRDIVPAVQKLGYRFSSSDPANSLGAYLYSQRARPFFKKTANGFIAK